LLNSKALTKIQALILVVVILITAISGSLVYLLWSESQQSEEKIKIGILADLDMPTGINYMNAAILAADEINAEGGVLGKQIEIIGEDSDYDAEHNPTKVTIALTRLLTHHKVDYVIVGGGEDFIIDAGVEHKKIILGTVSPAEALTQRVIDDYEKYKYFFRLRMNETAFATRGKHFVVETTDGNRIGFLMKNAEKWIEILRIG